MALYHFKQEAMEDQNLYQKEVNSTLHIRQDIFAAKPNGNQNCGQNQPNVMFGGINLGDIMRQTVMEEMKMISRENEIHAQRMGGS